MTNDEIIESTCQELARIQQKHLRGHPPTPVQAAKIAWVLAKAKAQISDGRKPKVEEVQVDGFKLTITVSYVPNRYKGSKNMAGRRVRSRVSFKTNDKR